MSFHSRRAIGPIDGLLLLTLVTVWGGGFLFVLMPISALLPGIAILDEPLEPRQLGGMGLIAAGLAAIDGRPFAAVRRLGASRRGFEARLSK